MENAQLRAERRDVLGKRVRFLRRQGLIPANLYGHGMESVALQLPAQEVEQLLSGSEGATLVKLAINGEEPCTALVKEVQRDPLRDALVHVDFQQVAMTELLRVEVPLHFVGEAPAVRALGGTLLHSIAAVEIEALPGDLPTHLEVDVSALADFHVALHVRDIPLPPGVQILEELDELVATVVPSAAAVEEARAAAQEAAGAAERAQPETVEEKSEA